MGRDSHLGSRIDKTHFELCLGQIGGCHFSLGSGPGAGGDQSQGKLIRVPLGLRDPVGCKWGSKGHSGCLHLNSGERSGEWLEPLPGSHQQEAVTEALEFEDSSGKAGEPGTALGE